MARRKGKNGPTPPQQPDAAPHADAAAPAPPPPIDPARRQELRRKLRNKIQSRQQGGAQQDAARQMINDPASALLRMGVDDASVLRAAPSLVKSITARARAGKPLTGRAGMSDTIQEVCGAIVGDAATSDAQDAAAAAAGGEVGGEVDGFELVPPVDSDDDEEAPPQS